MVNSIEIEYLEPKSEFRVGSVKNIAIPSNNKEDIKKVYPGSKKVESNADMLSQSFGSVPEITPIPVQNNNLSNNNEPIQISPIPNVQNTSLEQNPVSLETSSNLSENSVETPIVHEVVSIEQPNNFQSNGIVENSLAPSAQPEYNMIPEPSIPTIENTIDVAPSAQPEVIPIPEASIPTIENNFKVSDAPNIFDNPFPENKVEENTNIFNQPNDIKEDSVKSENLFEQKSNLKDDVISLEIAILEKNVKLYEELAENNRKMIELKKKQIKKEENEVNLENTASNLFNNSGVIDDDKVLGETPMPTLRVA